MNRIWGFFLAALVLTLPAPGFAKMYEVPKSFSLADKSLDRLDRKTMARIDPERLLAEDQARAKSPKRPGPLRFAVAEDATFTLENSGTWQNVPDGRLWRLRIQSPGAVSHNLGITRFGLPDGAKLWVYDPAHKRVEGPYTSRHRNQDGSLWTPIIDGDEIVIELFVPSGVSRPAVTIGKINKGYRDFSKDGANKSGSCNNDVICPVGNAWRNQIRSVARYTISGTSLCSGQLVNNTALDFKPYFLSAYHCGVSSANAGSLVFYWNYESPVCGNQSGGSLADNQTGATFRASSAASDFLLVELSATPDPSFNVFYSGWDASGAAPASTVGIHHPSGDEKSISFNTNAVTSTAYLSNTVSATANHWRVDDWEDGTTEGGSSGSCLWDAATGRCVGQLHGGYASCSAPNDSDWYGKLSVSWTGGGTNATRLSNWLDPGNTGTLAMDGDPHITTLDGTRYDFQGAGEYVLLRDRGGMEVQARMAPIATTFNPGPDPYTGLATCVSLNTAVAARVGKHRVTYQPNLSGVPDPGGLQLRVDGELMTLSPTGLTLSNGGRISKTAAPGGITIAFPDRYTLFVTPGWWASQSKWYLNIGMVRTSGTGSLSGASPGGAGNAAAGGLGGVVPSGSWLPSLPDGASMGPMPASLQDRYDGLYRKFGDAWRVTGTTTLFDYARGTSTDTFTLKTWPMAQPPCTLPDAKPVKPLSLAVAQRACSAIQDDKTRANCVFDVRVTGEPGFAKTYQLSQRIAAYATRIALHGDLHATRYGQAATFTATVSRMRGAKGVPTGAVQFMVDGKRAGEPIMLDANGRATWKATDLAPGTHSIVASYVPDAETAFLPSVSSEEAYVVAGH